MLQFLNNFSAPSTWSNPPHAENEPIWRKSSPRSSCQNVTPARAATQLPSRFYKSDVSPLRMRDRTDQVIGWEADAAPAPQLGHRALQAALIISVSVHDASPPYTHLHPQAEMLFPSRALILGCRSHQGLRHESGDCVAVVAVAALARVSER